MSTSRDDNAVPVLYGVSHLDGVTPVRINFEPGTRIMKMDTTTTIAFDPTLNATAPGGLKFATATSSADDSTVRPWVVNASTGAVLVDN